MAKATNMGLALAFVNLYREGVVYEKDELSRVIADFCDEFGIPMLNLVPTIEDFEKKGELQLYLRDGIHTTSLGAELYGAAVAEFLETWSRCLREPRVWDLPWSTKQFVPVSSIKQDKTTELSKFSRSFVDVEYLTIYEDSAISFFFPCSIRIHGAVFVTGPKSGWMKFNFPEAPYATRRLAYMETSYYRSISYFMIQHVVLSSQANVFTEPGLPVVALRKGEPDLGPRETHLVGFLVEEANWVTPR
jgi:hypothetical protein